MVIEYCLQQQQELVFYTFPLFSQSCHFTWDFRDKGQPERKQVCCIPATYAVIK